MKNKKLTVVYLARTYQWVIPVLLINLSAYWFLWSMFLVIDYTANMQCSISSKNCHDIAKSAASQTNSKSSKHNSMTPEFCKNMYQKIHFNDFRLAILGNTKV